MLDQGHSRDYRRVLKSKQVG